MIEPQARANEKAQGQRTKLRPIAQKIIDDFDATLDRIKDFHDADEILAEITPQAAKVLAVNLQSGNDMVRDKASKEILDRTKGRPVERQVTIQSKVYSMNSTEVDNELDRLLEKYGTRLATKVNEVRGRVIEETNHSRSLTDGSGGQLQTGGELQTQQSTSPLHEQQIQDTSIPGLK